MSQFRNLCKYYLGADWKWAEAVIEQESGGNPWELGDSGLAAGIMQQHPSFQMTYWPGYENVIDPAGRTEITFGKYATSAEHASLRFDPSFQIACFAEFRRRWQGKTWEDLIQCYNIGNFDTPDPEYLRKVQVHYDATS